MSSVAVAFLRGINVGGANRLAMTDLRALCKGAGLADVQTYIQSGNVVFRTSLDEEAVVEVLGEALAEGLGKPIGVVVRSAEEIDSAIGRNPFADEAPNRVHVIFLPGTAPSDAASQVSAPGGERVVVEGREVFVHYPNGAGQSKLKLPFAKEGTARNMNTVSRLAELAHTLSSD